MTTPRLRPMTPADIAPVSAAILADDWGDRRAWFDFAVAHPECHVTVAEADGVVVGTGVATVNGPVAWIGTIWVAPAWRGRRLGRALTQAPIDVAQSSGCRTLLLVATRAGQSLYERLGFAVQTWYVTMEAPGRLATPDAPAAADRPANAAPGAVASTIRAYRPADLTAMARLDVGATGEDRAHLLAAFAAPDGTRVLTGPDDVARAFLMRAPWGGGATIAPAVEDAMALLDARRDAYPADRRVRAGVLADNEAGLARLAADGWTEAWRAPRLLRGDPLTWQPTAIWGQFNHALG